MNIQFLKSHALIFRDLVELKSAVIMYKARNNVLPGNVQNMFM